MRQEITIDGLSIAYSIEEKNIRAVMGQGHIYRTLTYNDMINIIYRGCNAPADIPPMSFLTPFSKDKSTHPKDETNTPSQSYVAESGNASLMQTAITQ